MAARTLSRAIRNTSLDEWSVLLRETLQNSVDARLNDRRPIHFYVRLDEVTPEQRSSLKTDVFADLPSELKHLRTTLNRTNFPVLVIADWETRGLCGPTRADLATDERADFRDFFLNVGREESKNYQGGTFGLGRGVLFDISENGTIIVFTRSTAAGRPVTRLMAMSIGNAFDKARLKYTGRHWWGADVDSEWPEPVNGATAERIAGRLGLDVIPESKTGTAIMVLSPRIPEAGSDDDQKLELGDALDEMIGAARLFGWPLMVGRKGKPAVNFEFSHAGKCWEPEAPDTADSPVRHFVEAYRLAEQGRPEGPTSWHFKEISFGGGRAAPRPLGTLVLRHFPPLQDAREPENTGIPEAAIALMREPRMVVKYLKVARHPLGSSTVGVFIADRAFDQQFAESEPVAHDEWIPAKIVSAKYARNPVKQALDKIKQGVKDTWKTIQTNSDSVSEADGIAPVIGDMLGGMVADTAGFGGGRIRPPANGGGGKQVKSTRATVSPPNLRGAEEGTVVALFPVHIDRVTKGSRVTLRAEARVVLDGALEKEDNRPEGAPIPVIFGWQKSETDDVLMSDRDRVTVNDSVDELLVLVEQPHDMAVTVTVSASEAAG